MERTAQKSSGTSRKRLLEKPIRLTLRTSTPTGEGESAKAVVMDKSLSVHSVISHSNPAEYVPHRIILPESTAAVAIPLEKESDQELMRLALRTAIRPLMRLSISDMAAQSLSYLYRMLGGLEDVESDRPGGISPRIVSALTYRFPQRLSTWLFTITRNLAINQARRRKRNPVRNITELNLEGIDISGDPCRVAAGWLG